MTTEPCKTCGSLDGTALWQATDANFGPKSDRWHKQDFACGVRPFCTPCSDPCHQPKCRGCGNPIDVSTNLLIREADGVEYPWHQECYRPATWPQPCPMRCGAILQGPQDLLAHQDGSGCRDDKPATCPTCGGERGDRRINHTAATLDTRGYFPCTDPCHTKPQAKPAARPVSDGATELAEEYLDRLGTKVMQHLSQEHNVQSLARLIQDFADKATARAFVKWQKTWPRVAKYDALLAKLDAAEVVAAQALQERDALREQVRVLKDIAGALTNENAPMVYVAGEKHCAVCGKGKHQKGCQIAALAEALAETEKP